MNHKNARPAEWGLDRAKVRKPHVGPVLRSFLAGVLIQLADSWP